MPYYARSAYYPAPNERPANQQQAPQPSYQQQQNSYHQQYEQDYQRLQEQQQLVAQQQAALKARYAEYLQNTNRSQQNQQQYQQQYSAGGQQQQAAQAAPQPKYQTTIVYKSSEYAPAGAYGSTSYSKAVRRNSGYAAPADVRTAIETDYLHNAQQQPQQGYYQNQASYGAQQLGQEQQYYQQPQQLQKPQGYASQQQGYRAAQESPSEYADNQLNTVRAPRVAQSYGQQQQYGSGSAASGSNTWLGARGGARTTTIIEAGGPAAIPRPATPSKQQQYQRPATPNKQYQAPANEQYQRPATPAKQYRRQEESAYITNGLNDLHMAYSNQQRAYLDNRPAAPAQGYLPQGAQPISAQNRQLLSAALSQENVRTAIERELQQGSTYQGLNVSGNAFRVPSAAGAVASEYNLEELRGLSIIETRR